MIWVWYSALEKPSCLPNFVAKLCCQNLLAKLINYHIIRNPNIGSSEILFWGTNFMHSGRSNCQFFQFSANFREKCFDSKLAEMQILLIKVNTWKRLKEQYFDVSKIEGQIEMHLFERGLVFFPQRCYVLLFYWHWTIKLQFGQVNWIHFWCGMK